MALTPLVDFSNATIFTPTSGANVAKMKQVNNQYFVKRVDTWEQALACGAVLLVNGNDWIIIGAKAAAALKAQNKLPCTFQPAPKLVWDDRGLGLPNRCIRIDPAYAIAPALALDVKFAGIPTRAHAIFGWSRMLSNPFVVAPTMLNVVTTISVATPNGLNGFAQLAENPMKDTPAVAEVATLSHPFGVVDLFKRPEVQAILDDWEDAEEFIPAAVAYAKTLPNISAPSPLAHVWTPSAHYFGPGFAAEVRGVRGPRVGDVTPDDTIYPAKPDALAWASATEYKPRFQYFMPNGAQGEYNTNAAVKTVSSLGTSLDGVIVSNAQWVAPAMCYDYLAPVAEAQSYKAVFVASSNGKVLGVTGDVRPRLHKKAGAETGIILPWIDCCDPMNSLWSPGGYYSLDAPFSTFNTAGSAGATGLGLLCSELILNKGVRPALPAVGVPETISGQPALHVLGGTFIGSYYGTDFLKLPVTGVAIQTQDLIKTSPPALTVSFEQAPVNTAGMTPAEAESAERAAEAAFAAWKRPDETSIKTERSPERWIYSMADAFADLIGLYYDKIEQLARDKYE